MKALLVLVAVIGLGNLSAGQTGPVLRDITYAPNTHIMANAITYDEASHTTFARGHVRIASESSTITADEADLHHLKDTRTAVDFAIDLRGNVRVIVAPAVPR